MQARKKHLASTITAICALGAGAISVNVSAQQSQPAQKVEKIEVTGSNIKRVDIETVAPITIITREDIERSGRPTISEVLRGSTYAAPSPAISGKQDVREMSTGTLAAMACTTGNPNPS